jgi:hypothetical protein
MSAAVSETSVSTSVIGNTTSGAGSELRRSTESFRAAAALSPRSPRKLGLVDTLDVDGAAVQSDDDLELETRHWEAVSA